MLILNGYVKGKMFNNEQVPAETLIELFDLPVDLHSRKPRMVLTLTQRYIQRDRLNGGEKFSSGHFLTTAIDGEYDGNIINVQYAERKIQRPGPIPSVEYQPRHIPFIGKSNAYAATRKEPKDLEKLVFMLLHPKCQNSPLSGPAASDKKYQIDDAVTKAAKVVTNVQSFMEVYNQVLTAPISVMRTKLAGIKRMNVEPLEDTEVQAQIFTMMQNDPEGFYKKWSMHTTSFEGLINRAINLAVVEKYGVGNGQAWRFSKTASEKFLESPTPINIVNIRQGQTPEDALRDWVLADATNLSMIQNVINGLDAEAKGTLLMESMQPLEQPKAATSVTEMDTKGLVEYALANDLIAVIKEGSEWQAYFLKSGDLDVVITAVPSYKERVGALVAHMESEEADRKTLYNKVRGSMARTK